MMRYIIAGCIICCIPLRFADGQSNAELDQLTRSIAEIESYWHRCTVEIIETKWAEPSEQIQSSCRSYILLDQCFREHDLGYSFSEGQPSPFRMRQWDGRLETDVIPQRLVEQRDSPIGNPPPSLPYGVLLNTIGVDGDLAQFLDAEATSDVELKMELFEVDEGRVGVRRRSRLLAAETWDVVEIQLNAASEFQALSLRRYQQSIAEMRSRSRQTSATTAMLGEETTVEVSRCEIGPSKLQYDIRIDTIDLDSEIVAPIRTQRIRASKLDDGVQFSDVRIMELMGNPTIRTHQSGKKNTDEPFYPVDRPAEATWPVIDQWMMINNILMWSLLGMWLLRFVFKFVSSRLI